MIEGMVTEEEIYEALNEIIDPELGLGFVEIGLIYTVDVNAEGSVYVTYSLTSPGCPIADQVEMRIADALSDLAGVTEVESELTFTPPWTVDRMSEDAKFALGF